MLIVGIYVNLINFGIKSSTKNRFEQKLLKPIL